MDDRMQKIADALYKACAETNFKARYSRDHRDFTVDFFRTNHKSNWITFSAWFGWREYHFQQEESVGRDITEDEALVLLKEGFAEFGVTYEV